ncbi:MAG TPA: hypothetical protein VLL75_04765 [Vicinamibacteria bacterium]|nr:hypothetical protein [Vicinamibacteria bacterium]
MLTAGQQQLVSLGLAFIGLYFAVQLARGAAGFRRYRSVAPTALATWPTPRPARLPLLIALGASGAVLALVLAWQHKPVHHVVGFALMAAYFLGMVPLARTIRLGVYRGGVWAHRGFLPWGEVARIAFVEGPPIVLLLKPRRGSASYKLPVPGAEYGAVRKLLEEKAREGVLNLDPAILGI